MTQTTVTFATDYTYTGGVVNIGGTETRVFDAQIDASNVTWYNQLITTLKNYPNGNPPTSSADFISALQCLDDWSKMRYVDAAGNQVDNAAVSQYGLYEITHGNFTQTVSTTMSSDMAQSLDSIQRLLGSFGFALNTAGINTPAALGTAWTAMSTAQVTDTFEATLAAATSAANSAKVIGARSGVQEMLMTDYVAHGNELLYSEMSQLQDAISINQTVLNYCNGLQDLMNLKEPEKFTLALSFLEASNGQITDAAYNKFEEQSFNQTIGTELLNSMSKDDLLTYCKANQGLFQDAFKVLDTSVLPAPVIDGKVQDHDYSSVRIADNIRYLYNQINAKAVAIGDTSGALTNLQSALNNVYKNLTVTGDLSANPQVLIPPTNSISSLGGIPTPADSVAQEALKNTVAAAFIGPGYTNISLSINNGALTVTGGIAAGTYDAFSLFINTSIKTIPGISSVDISAVQVPQTSELVGNHGVKNFAASTLMGMSASECASLTIVSTSPTNCVVTGLIDSSAPYLLSHQVGQTIYYSLVGLTIQFNVTVATTPDQLAQLAAQRATPPINSVLAANGGNQIGTYINALATALRANSQTSFDNLSIAASSSGTGITLSGVIPSGTLATLNQLISTFNVTNPAVNINITGDTNTSPVTLPVVESILPLTADGVALEAAKASAATQLIAAGFSTTSLSLTTGGDLIISGTIPLNKTNDLKAVITAIQNMNISGVTKVINHTSEQTVPDTLLPNLVTWIKDFSTTGTSGDFQRNLTNATTASQSFNDTERENLNRVMFIFQEFYQSASTLLSAMNDMINKMISMITRQ